MVEYFAEHLPRLKTTTVQVEIPRGDVQTCTVNDDEVLVNSVSIKLPKRIDSSETTQAITPVGDSTIIRLREATTMLVNDSVESLLQDQYQWNINNLKKYHVNDTFKCIKCKKPLIQLSDVSRFLPMPSELWYEMLDFWHCHKPNVDNDKDKNIGLLKKFNQLKPGVKNMIIGSYYFIVNPEDWDMLVIDERLECGCGEALGGLDANIGSFKLLKWELELDNVPFRPYSYVSLKLVEEMNFTAVRVFNVINEATGKIVTVWCFGLGIDVNVSGQCLQNCLKIMYKESSDTINGEILIEYEKPYDDFIELITRINCSLPLNLRKFNDWKVSYIPV